MKNSEIISTLAQKMAAGELSSEYVLPLIRKLSDKEKHLISDTELLELLRTQSNEPAEKLFAQVSKTLHRKVLEYHRLKNLKAPVPNELTVSLKDFPLENLSVWHEKADIINLKKTLKHALDYAFTLKYQDRIPEIQAKIKHKLINLAKQAVEMPEWGYIFSKEIFRQTLTQGYSDCPELKIISATLEDQFNNDETKKRRQIDCELEQLPKTLPSNIDKKMALEIIASRYTASTDKREKKSLFDLLCTWPDDSVIPFLNKLVNVTSTKERASMIMSLRFGQPEIKSWANWQEWLSENSRNHQTFIAEVKELTDKYSELLLALWYLTHENKNQHTFNLLIELGCNNFEKISPEEFVTRYKTELGETERDIILNQQTPTLQKHKSIPVPPPLPCKKHKSLGELHSQTMGNAEKTQNKREIPLPSLWQNHIQPFFAENWYMAAGIFMVIAGSSLLAFYTWDKHWLVPYTIMPLLLACFTAGLAGVGNWVEKRGKEFLSMAAMLRGAATGLLPVNFMAVALLSNDDRVSHKLIIVPLMGIFYLLLGDWGLRRWCSAIHHSLEKLLGRTLLLINALVIIAPLAKTFQNIETDGLNMILGTGFYLGFGVMAFAVIKFTKHIINRQMAAEKRIPWFFGATLAVTFLQVFAWVHGSLGYLPQVYTYAPMVILTGGLVLLVEKRSLQLKHKSSTHEMESFLGFALIIGGVLMGMPNNVMRILSLELAGFLWLFQAFSRRHPLHYWISLTLIVLGGMSISLLEPVTGIWLPTGQWMPILGISITLCLSAFLYLADRYKNHLLREASSGMQTVILTATSIVTVLTQWHYTSNARLTAVYLIVITAIFLWRAFRDQKLRWLHTAMLISALTLPYLGCVDVMHKTIQGNSMVFGLAVISILWLGTIWLVKHPLLIKARSTVVLFYGITALAAMLVRILIQHGAPGNIFMDYTGPLLIAAVLVVISYYSRSLIPSIIAAFILIILFPELKSHFRTELDSLGWGTGFGSVCTAFGLLIACFFLRKSKSLKALGEGDLFLGKTPFYFRRFDHTLFTWPLLASAFFLVAKTDTITFVKNLIHNGQIDYNSFINLPLKTCMALVLTGICWTLLGIYYRRHRLAAIGIHLGWIWILTGLACTYYSCAETPHWTKALLCGTLIIQLRYFIYRFWLQKKLPWVENLMTKQMLYVLRYSSPILALICMISIIFIQPLFLYFIAIFTTLQLIWHGLKTRNIFYGVLLYFLAWVNLLSLTTPGSENLFIRLSYNFTLAPTLYFLLCIQLIVLVFEFIKPYYAKLNPIMAPLTFLSSLFVVITGLIGFADVLYFSNFTGLEQLLLLLLIFMTARTQACNPLAVMGLLLSYLYIHPFPNNAGLYDKIIMIISPWKLSLLGFVFVMLTQGGRKLHSHVKQFTAGAFRQSFYNQPSPAWFWLPAIAIAVVAALYQTFNPAFRSDSIQSLAPFISAVTLLSIGFFWNVKFLYWVAIIFWSLGNIHTVRIYSGAALLSRSLSHIHLICLGVAATMLETSLVKKLLNREKITVFANLVCLLIAFIVLCLLSANYFVNPNLLDITWLRFAISGSMALIAGLYFRRAARCPGFVEENLIIHCEALYHYGISITIWCAALMIPWFRTPATALFALGLPVLYFYLHTEANSKYQQDIANRYRSSAATLSFIILALYVFRFAFRMMLFPDNPIVLMHYHYSAPVVILLAVIMFRLHGLGGTFWLAFYGGLSLMLGTYFSFTTFPKMSPFYYPVNAAWCAIIFSHFWTLVSYKRSPIRTAIQQMAHIDKESWHNFRRSWGVLLILATQLAMLWGLVNCKNNTYMIAPLLAGGATVLVHHGMIKRSPLYFSIAALELLFALHADFLTPSWLQKEYVIWSLTGMWTAMLIIHEIIRLKFEIKKITGLYLGFAILLMLHIFYHGAASTVGLWAFAAGAVLAALTPCITRRAPNNGKLLPAALLLWTPTWLIFFSQVKDYRFLTAWTVLVTAASIFITGILVKSYQLTLSYGYEQLPRHKPRLFDRTLAWLGNSSNRINIVSLCVTLCMVFIITLTNYLSGLSTNNFIIMLLLYLSLTAAWYFEGLRLKRMLPFFIMLGCVFMTYAAVQRQIVLTMPNFWKPEYDIWTTLIVSSVVSALLQIRTFRVREVRIPFTFTLCAMPLLALIWSLSHHLGSNSLLLIVGLYSVIFVFMGKEDRESPYHIAAVSGFIVFLLILFWSKLQIKAIHAYIIPVGTGVLILVQMFKASIRPQIRNHVRFITLMAMLGSSGYYVIIGSGVNIIYITVLGVLSLFAMILGSMLKVKLYLLLGFTGVIVNVGVIFCKLVIRMQRNTQMTIIGSLVLISGIAIVAGAIYYKTHRDKIMQMVTDIGQKLQNWE